ncbi:MAG: DUF615 domain-containing protein [Pseudomonadota bacterium]|nr:MAG: DUF615 domain-containing protein [Pseudomonadota bacterium]
MDEHSSNERPSKSQRKRDAHQLQALGKQLVGLSRAQLTALELPGELFEAITAAQAIAQHGARRRQLQYIGKLMRRIDTTSIQASLDALNESHRADTTAFHRVEQWRDRLLQEGDSALGTLRAACPDIDLQRIRTLVRTAQRETAENRAPRAARELFRYLRTLQSVLP